MKLVLIDNFAKETVDDLLLAENVPQMYAQHLANAWNNKFCNAIDSPRFCVVKFDDYTLYKFKP